MADYELTITVIGRDQTGPLAGATTSLGRIGEVAMGILTSQVFNRIGEGVSAMGRMAISGATDFETGMNLVQTNTGATGAQFESLKQLARDLGGDLTLPATSAGDAAEAMLELSKAGFDVNDIMTGTRGALELAAAGNLSNARAAEIAANALNAFGLEGSKATEVANLLAAADLGSSVSVNQVADAFQMASAVFSEFQGPVVGAENAMTDLTASIMVLGNAGIKGSDAGTSLKQMLMQLTGPSDKAKDAMRALYLATTDTSISQDLLTTAISGAKAPREEAVAQIEKLTGQTGQMGDIAFDASGKMRPLEEIVRLTAQATAGMTDEQRDYAIATIFGADATRAILALMRSMGPEARTAGLGFADMKTKLDNHNAAADLAATRMRGLGGAFQQVRSQLETSLLSLTEPMLPFLTSMVQEVAQTIPRVEAGIRDLVSRVRLALAAFQEGNAEGGLGTGAFGLLRTIGLDETTAGYAAGIISQVGSVIQTGMGVIQAAMQVVGPIALGVFTVLATGSQMALPHVLILGNSVGQLLTLAFQTLAPYAQQAGQILQNLAPIAGGLLVTAISGLNSAVQFLIQNWQTVTQIAAVVGVALGAGALVSGILAAASTVGTLIAAGQGLILVITSAGSVVGVVGPIIGAAIAALGGPITLVIAAVAALGVAWSTNLFGIRDVTSQAWTAIQGFFSGGIAAVQARMSAWWAQQTADWTAATAVWSSTASGWWTSVQTTWTSVTTALGGRMSAWWTEQQTGWTTATAQWKAGIDAFWAGAQATWNTTTATIRTTWNTWAANLSAAWDTWHTGISTAVSTWWTGVQTTWATTQAAVRTAWDTWSANLRAAWDTWHTGVQTATSTWWTALQTAWATTTASIRSAWDTWSANLRAAWDSWHTAVRTAVSTWWSALQTAWATATTAIRSAWDTWSANLRAAWETWQGLLSVATGVFWSGVTLAWSVATTAIRNAWNTWSTALRTAWSSWLDTIWGRTESWWSAVLEMWRSWQDTVRGAWDSWSSSLRSAWFGWLDSIWGRVSDWWSSVLEMWRSWQNEVRGAVESWFNGVVVLFEYNLWRVVAKIWDFRDAAFNVFAGWANAVLEKVRSMLRSMIDAVSDAVNRIIDLINSIPGLPDIGGGGGGGGEGGGDLGGDSGGGGESGFATGGVVPATAKYLLHAGEVVLNPDQQASVLANLAAAGAQMALSAVEATMGKLLATEGAGSQGNALATPLVMQPQTQITVIDQKKAVTITQSLTAQPEVVSQVGQSVYAMGTLY